MISGIAGAYASAKKEVAKSLAGVAIAVALVPPLSVAGIGLGWGDLAMARGALLLFTTNLVGIVLAAVLSFLVLGFAPFKLAKKGLLISLAVLVAIVSPLYFSFMDLVVQGRIIDSIPSGTVEIAGKQIDLRVARVRVSRLHQGERVLVQVVVTSSEVLGMDDLDRLKERIKHWTGRQVELEAEFHLRH